MTDRIITKVNAKDKVLDFRDNLIVSGPSAYAMLHGMGGKKHAMKSTIKVVICDYSRGTGENSVTVSTNISPDVVSYLYKMSEQAMQTSSLSNFSLSISSKTALRNVIAQLGKVRNDVANGRLAEDVPALSEQITAMGKALASVVKEIEPQEAGPAFQYEQQRVNPYQIDANGMAPVSYLTIQRNGLRNGAKARYPWQIAIKSGIARVVQQANGACSFDGKSFQCQGQAAIFISDQDMYRMMFQCVHFISVWENAMCLQQVSAGVQAVQREREQYYNAQQY